MIQEKDFKVGLLCLWRHGEKILKVSSKRFFGMPDLTKPSTGIGRNKTIMNNTYDTNEKALCILKLLVEKFGRCKLETTNHDF